MVMIGMRKSFRIEKAGEWGYGCANFETLNHSILLPRGIISMNPHVLFLSLPSLRHEERVYQH